MKAGLGDRMESSTGATEKDRKLSLAPWLRPRPAEGRTHSSRANPGVRLQSRLARPRLGVKAGRGFHQVPSPWAGRLGTCWNDFSLGRDGGTAGGAGTSGPQRQPLGPGILAGGGQPVLAGTTWASREGGTVREGTPAEETGEGEAGFPGIRELVLGSIPGSGDCDLSRRQTLHG
uniref:Uncharacterized protein n=1 Tax=Mustela putorius furo TaxID=9669 RepID=M3YSN3_MUSPF